MSRMLVLGYVFAIRSERLICREVQVNFAYRWFCKLGIEDAIPDHSAFSRARDERFREGDVFRHVFERVVEACLAAGLVGGEGFAVDASLPSANKTATRLIECPRLRQAGFFDRQAVPSMWIEGCSGASPRQSASATQHWSRSQKRQKPDYDGDGARRDRRLLRS
jgi:hypothetical protein